MQKAPLLDRALEYLALGWSVFPARNKKPLIKWADYQKRLATEEEVRQWWTDYPDAQICIATGLSSGLIVLDLDGPEGKASTKGLQFPRTVGAKTGNGLHYYYKHPGLDNGEEVRNFAKRLPGVDLRGDGGYVVVPPSLHSVLEGGVERYYEWTTDPADVALSAPPAWLLELIQERGKPKPKPKGTGGGDVDDNPWYLQLMALGVDEGSRNDAIARLAGYLLGIGMDEEAVLYTIEAFNATKVRPPLPEEEVETTVRSIAKAERRKAEGAAALESEEYTHDERRTAALELASGKLGFSLERVIKYMADPPVYELSANGARLRLGPIQNLIEYTPFKRQIADGLGRLIKLPRKEWPEVAEWLLRAVEELDVAEATDRGQFEAWLAAYLEEDNPAPEDHWQEAAWDNRPITRDRRIYVSLSAFRRYVSTAAGEKVSLKELAVTARAIGLEAETIGVNLQGRQTTRSYWSIPGSMAERIKVRG